MLTSLDFLQEGASWPPPSEAERLQRYAANKLLFESKHEVVFSDSFRRLIREEDRSSFEIIVNWPKRLSTLWADFLFGEPPEFSAGSQDDTAQSALRNIVERNNLIVRGYEAAIDMSRYGEAVFKVRFDKFGRIELVPPNIWFPVVSPDNIKETTHHVLAWSVPVPGLKTESILRVEIHEPGKVTYQRYTLRQNRVGEKLEEHVEVLPIDAMLVRHVPNISTSDSVYGFDDYEDVQSIVSEIEVRIGQISRILDKHADPSMYGDENALEHDPDTGQWSVRGGSKFFPVSPGGVTPGYLAWDGQLDAAFKQVDLLMEQFYAVSETSPAAFGQLKHGLAESGSALKRLLVTPLAKVNRLRLQMDPALKDLLLLAARLEVSQRMAGAAELEDVSITWQDGLPDDEREQTEMANARVAAGTLSRRSAVARLDGLEGEALDAEMEQIETERSESLAPSGPTLATGFNFGESGDDDLDLDDDL